MNDYKIDDSILLLKNHPKAEEIESILTYVLNTTSNLSINFRLVTTLLNYTIPETYVLLSDRIQQRIIQIFRSVTGLGNLISKISLLDSNDSNVRAILETLILILTQCFNSKLVFDLIPKGTSSSQIKEIDKLLFKGKCFSIVNEVVSNQKIEIKSLTFASSDNYVGYLNTEILHLLKEGADIRTINVFINSLNSFNSNSSLQYFDLMFNENNWSYAISSFKNMKRFEQKNFLTRLIGHFVTKKYLSTNISNEKLNSIAVILKPIFESYLIDDTFLNKIIAVCNFPTNLLVSILVSGFTEDQQNQLVLRLLATWADEHLIKTETISLQEFRTHLIILMILRQKNVKFAQNLLDNHIFLRAISQRLSSFSNNVKSLGVILADKVCEFGGREKIFQLDNVDGYDFLLSNDAYCLEQVADITIDDAWYFLNNPEVIEECDEKSKDSHDLVEDVKKVSISMEDSDDETDFESDEEDDPTISTNSHVAKPLYIKDILEYLSTDSKQPQAYEKRRMALKTGPTLLRQKSKFGTEVSFYAEDLLTQLVGLTDTYEDSDFDELRLNCLIAVIVSNSSSTLHLFQLFLNGDYSLKQRMCILSAVSLAARELKGFRDEVVSKSYKKKAFPSKTLPGQLHQEFSYLESKHQKYVDYKRIDPIYESIQDEIVCEVSEDAKNKISAGKILRLSSNLKKKNKRKAITPLVENFPKIISSQFYFPLIKIWHDIGGEIDIGHYSPLLTAHYIKTLALLLHAAYPTAIGLNDMIKEFFLVVTPLTYKISLDDLQIIESIVTGILLICDIIDEQYLVIYYSDELGIFQRWLTLTWEDIIDDKIKSLCAGLLLRLNELNGKFERILLDQRNGIY